MNGLIIIGHSARTSFNHALAARVAATLQAAGHSVVPHDLTVGNFDPRLTPEEARGEPGTGALVRRHRAGLARADLLAVIQPVMRACPPPAVVKGRVDRMFCAKSCVWISPRCGGGG
jgi:putative NADPH-quinone reductase